ncbi:hypothetical protein Vau01_099070 [Virgisporangium aurantiacum]|uniref:Uncharacterized protein n=1 Tax=Virgisporangium aurantiacum TaxID=175570 RepID=A0A8J3ZIY6_9ACTN|nr:hypothetical protein Vau01_099070 [Virgisporangium aurantiacum]
MIEGWRRDIALVLAVHSVAKQARSLRQVRDPKSRHLGQWANGILQRATGPEL